jgi:cell division septation protein DedD
MIEPTLSDVKPVPEEDVTTTLYRAAIGPVSSGYYLPIFTRFEAADHGGISWNTAASLLTLNWLVFRKLWVAALAYVSIIVALALLVFGIGHVVLQFSDTLMMILGLGFGLAAFVLPGLFGNTLFHTECRKAMSKALVGSANVADARDALLRQASTRRRAIWLAAANAACLLIGVVVYLQVAALSSITVMPQGAVETSPTSLRRAMDGASTPITPITPISAISPMAQASDTAPALALAASATASAVVAAASAPEAPASVATPAASEPQSHSVAAVKSTAAPKEEAKPKKQAAASKKAKPVASAIASKKAGSRPFFINVGLFSVPENAARANAKLLEAKLPSVVKELKSTKGRQIRVRVGPLASQEAAEAAAKKIKALDLEASIIHP